ncbi:hypothetical protein [Halodesulfovibrio aestuarii]|uniref:hypothetical protein n=1 Tax=Halodesulfovibrio aestuarii TaxID=126333 RepID=UPI00041E3B9B
MDFVKLFGSFLTAAKGLISEQGLLIALFVIVVGGLCWKKMDSSPHVSLRNVKATNIAGRDIKVGKDAD